MFGVASEKAFRAPTTYELHLKMVENLSFKGKISVTFLKKLTLPRLEFHSQEQRTSLKFFGCKSLKILCKLIVLTKKSKRWHHSVKTIGSQINKQYKTQCTNYFLNEKTSNKLVKFILRGIALYKYKVFCRDEFYIQKKP